MKLGNRKLIGKGSVKNFEALLELTRNPNTEAKRARRNLELIGNEEKTGTDLSNSEIDTRRYTPHEILYGEKNNDDYNILRYNPDN